MSALEWEIKSLRSTEALKKFLSANYKELDEYDWSQVLRNQAFNVELIDDYCDFLSWRYISTFIILPPEMIEKYIGRMTLHSVSAFQPLTKDLIEKYKHTLSLNKLENNSRIPPSLKEYAIKVFKENDDPCHHKRWDYNLKQDSTFCPKNFVSKFR